MRVVVRDDTGTEAIDLLSRLIQADTGDPPGDGVALVRNLDQFLLHNSISRCVRFRAQRPKSPVQRSRSTW